MVRGASVYAATAFICIGLTAICQGAYTCFALSLVLALPTVARALVHGVANALDK